MADVTASDRGTVVSDGDNGGFAFGASLHAVGASDRGAFAGIHAGLVRSEGMETRLAMGQKEIAGQIAGVADRLARMEGDRVREALNAAQQENIFLKIKAEYTGKCCAPAPAPSTK